jgi:hypothetical protein
MVRAGGASVTADGMKPESLVDVHRVVWPRARRVVEPGKLAPRLSTLEGRTIAFLWDSVFRGDEIFPILESALRHRFPGARFVGWDAFGSTFGGDESRTIGELPDRLRKLGVDAVVSGVGC